MIWSPNLACDCTPSLHKKCWAEWVQRGHGICIICREHPEEPEEPEEAEEPRETEIQIRLQPVPFWHNYKYILILNITLYVLFCAAVIAALQDRLTTLSLKDEL
jgi:hypothetical protein